MGRYIAWDTSRNTGLLCAFEHPIDGELRLKHVTLLDVGQRQHSEGLFVGIQDALEACGWNWSDLTAIGIGIGPGSFTGVRVGLTAARTFGQVLGLPLIPVSSLAVVSRWAGTELPEDSPSTDQMICMEACMGEVYCRFEPGAPQGDSQIQADAQERVIKLAELDGWVSGLGMKKGSVVVCSARLSQNPLLRAALLDGAEGMGFSWREDAIVAQSWGRALANEVIGAAAMRKPMDALEVHPAYLRAPDAELKLKQKQGIPS